MIFGIGVDQVDINRVRSLLEKSGSKFENRCFTVDEILYSKRFSDPAKRLSARFAAKEACSKALGTGFRLGVYWKNIEVVNEKSGKPSLKLTGGAYERLKKLTPIGSTHNISLSITDDFPWAQANVIIEVIKNE